MAFGGFGFGAFSLALFFRFQKLIGSGGEPCGPLGFGV